MSNKDIYRRGSRTYKNLTPRKIDTEGLSFSLNCPDPKYLATVISQINATGKLLANIDNERTGHVSVYPVDIKEIDKWIKSRGTCDNDPHEYTIILHNIVNSVV